MSTEVNHNVVLVTGANRGIGKAIVEQAIAEGAAKVYAAVRNLDSAADLVERFGDRVVPIRVDLNDPETIRRAASEATDVRIVINNAGIASLTDVFAETAAEEYEAEHRVNVLGWLHVAQAFAPVLESNGGGALVQLNSVVSIKSFADFATYSASKAASYSLTQAIRESGAARGIQVVSVHPGPIKTDMADNVGLGDVAESPTLVAEAIFRALRDDTFHVFPDSMATQFGDAYNDYAKSVIEAEMTEDSAP